MKTLKYLLSGIVLLVAVTSCEDYLEVEPVNLIGDETVIEDLESLEAAVLGMYSSMQGGNVYGELQIFMPAILSDEMVFTGTFPTKQDMSVNNVTSENVTMRGVWADAYTTIFIANTILERAENAGEPDEIATAIAEAKFGRALSLLNLVKLWGAVPLALTSSVAETSVLPRAPESEVYNQIIQDLNEAIPALPGKDEFGTTRATQNAARAILARAYLYAGDLNNAGILANLVIESGDYELDPVYSNIFDQNASSPERIFELFASIQDGNNLGFFAQPVGLGGRYDYSPSPALYASMSDNDQRKAMIVPNTADATGILVTQKYSDPVNGTDQPQVVRLAEMYLIRAEANQDVSDINAVRTLRGETAIGAYSDVALYRERELELAFEGHRWFDLRRSGRINEIMGALKPASWNPTDVLLPIPQREIDQNPTLTQADQNPGY